jgi:hypothetical protein
MSVKDPHLQRWAIEHQQETQARSEHQAYAIGPKGSGAMPGAGGVQFDHEDNQRGKRSLVFEARPVLLGRVEIRAQLTTQAPDQVRGHRKTAYITATPQALRDLARQLLETADAADRNKPRPTAID